MSTITLGTLLRNSDNLYLLYYDDEINMNINIYVYLFVHYINVVLLLSLYF